MNTGRKLQLIILLTILAFAGWLAGGERVVADNTYFLLAPGNSLLQNWTDTSLITAASGWNNIPSINGYSGSDGAVSDTGIDPQTILTDYSATLSVQANQAVPNTHAVGGVSEFHIADPAVAIMGSGTADFPYLDLRLNTTGCVSPFGVHVRYNVRDLDGSADLAVSQVALQYRVGSSGNYTNIPEGYISDASDTGTATKVTPIAVILPASTLGQPQVHVRVMTSNSPGNDEWLGIDDINVSCLAPTAAGVRIAGRVIDVYGRAISRATVTLISGDGVAKQYYTNTFGYYRFEDVRVGESYVVTVSARKYTFSNPTVFVNLGDEITGLNFIADR